MIINKLELFNFRQFIGKQEIEFSTDPDKNVTVLIGVNTSGKTTIVRAFEWCLYGKNGFDDKCLLNSEVKNQMHTGETQSVNVKVEFTHDSIVYTLKREFIYTCVDRRTEGAEIVVDLNIKSPIENVTLEYLNKDGQTKTAIDESMIKESMDRIIPKDLSDYFFFGGERISNIANRDDLSSAVKGLMRLDILQNARTHLTSVIKGFQNGLDTSGDSRAQRAKDSLETYKKQLEQYKNERDNAEKQMNYWKSQEKEYSVQLSNSGIEKIQQAQREKEDIISALDSAKKYLSSQKEAMINHFNTRPYGYFGIPTINKTLECLEELQNSQKVVESVPDMEQGAIDHLIHRGYCICGTRLEKGTIPYLKIMEERKVLPPEYIGSAIQAYKSKAEGYLAGADGFENVISDDFKQIRDTQRRIGTLEDQLKEKEDQIIDDTAAKEIERKRRDAETQYNDAKKDYDAACLSIGGCEKSIADCEATIDAYARSNAKNNQILKYVDYSQAVYDWIDKTYKEKEVYVRTELEKRVNVNFSKMYHGERTIMIDDKYRVKYTDIKTEESDGLKAVKSFAFIASLVSMAKDKILDDSTLKLGQVYPLVMDAPFSNVDEIHINNICQILPKTAGQVIMAVMQKDWEYAAKNLKSSVGKSYQVLKDTDADGNEIDTSTHIR